MKSRFLHLKDLALKMRKEGVPLGRIGIELGIPKSTLSYWFIGIQLTDKQRTAIKANWLKAINESRGNAIRWHNRQKAGRIEVARLEAEAVMSRLNLTDASTLELALAILYLGEGSKKSSDTSLGSSDPTILKFFVYCMKKLYGVSPTQARFYLHLRADQKIGQTREYWAETLKVPIENFKSTSLDKRTSGKPTYLDYKGVCVVSYGRVAIQRRLVWISRLFCEKIATMRG
ncbi:hypothetical protein A3F39_04155 [Candidatus Berkelbacteria bacterium RIFCSPHIGHO2_12_FULL_50_11]|nr:MAG: hypothetical protein A3F39_04155 [Candidatus Berkelbacteria bacterium RIFCSPHIGHO2_12_FULL_50_11]